MHDRASEMHTVDVNNSGMIYRLAFSMTLKDL